MKTVTTPAKVKQSTFAKNVASVKANGVPNMATITRLLSAYGKASKEDQQAFKDALYEGDETGIAIQADMAKQCEAWLLGLWKTPTGAARKNNPFGYREQNAIENFGSAKWVDTYQYGNYSHQTAPLFDIYTKDGEFGFQYYVNGGQIHIIG